MNVGMLWLDSDESTTLFQRLEDAARYYRDKYGRPAQQCVIHPETAGDHPPGRVAEMVIRVRPDALRRHFWIGDEAIASVG